VDTDPGMARLPECCCACYGGLRCACPRPRVILINMPKIESPTYWQRTRDSWIVGTLTGLIAPPWASVSATYYKSDFDTGVAAIARTLPIYRVSVYRAWTFSAFSGHRLAGRKKLPTHLGGSLIRQDVLIA